ncbi:MAG: lactate racemase domain-containing protein [Nitrospiria bacterium]
MQEIALRWKAWHGEENTVLTFPEGWHIEVCPMTGAPALSDGEIRTALSSPIGTPPLSDLAKGAQRAAIAVDDTSRPTPISRLLPHVLSELAASGIEKQQTKIIVALGSHAPLSEEELDWKLGPQTLRDYPVLQHDAQKNLSKICIDLDGIPVRINQDFMEADLKITMGGITPHPFAGYSAGGKMVLPGLASLEIIERTHKFVAMGFRGGLGIVEGNRFREDVEKVGRRCKLDLIVDVVLNQHREIAGVFAGDFVTAFQKGVDFAREVYRTALPEEVDVALLNAYPKDSDLVQSENAFNLLRSAQRPFIKETGKVILMTAATHAEGAHGLFSPGGRLYRRPLPKRWLKQKELIVFSPAVSEETVRKLVWEGYPFCRRWDAVIHLLKESYPDGCRLSVFPSSAIQMGASV